MHLGCWDLCSSLRYGHAKICIGCSNLAACLEEHLLSSSLRQCAWQLHLWWIHVSRCLSWVEFVCYLGCVRSADKRVKFSLFKFIPLKFYWLQILLVAWHSCLVYPFDVVPRDDASVFLCVLLTFIFCLCNYFTNSSFACNSILQGFTISLIFVLPD